MKDRWKNLLLKDNGQMLLWIGALVLNIVTFLLLKYKIEPSTEELVLHYNVIVGADSLGQSNNLYTLPIIGGVVLILNFIISRLVKLPFKLIGFLGAFVSFVVAVSLLVSAIAIIRIN